MGKHNHTFVIAVKLDEPPQKLVTITYTLKAEPKIDQNALPTEHRSPRVQWMHDEVELVCRKHKKHFTHAILFSNGWEVQLSFLEVRVAVTQRLLPLAHPSTLQPSLTPSGLLQPA